LPEFLSESSLNEAIARAMINLVDKDNNIEKRERESLLDKHSRPKDQRKRKENREKRNSRQ
jgi:hypothetical protein